MAKTEAGDKAVPAVVENEDKELFGHLSDEERAHADLTDDERVGMSDEDEDETGTGESEAGDDDADPETEVGTAVEQASGTGTLVETAENHQEGFEADEADEGGPKAAAETDKGDGTASEKAADDDLDDPLLETRMIMPDEWALPENARGRVGDLEAEIADLATRFDDGDLTASEYRKKAQELDDERMALKIQIGNAERAFAQAMGHWEHRTVRRFLREHSEWSRSKTRLQMLDAEVRRLQTDNDDPFDPRILLRAHRNLMAEFGAVATKTLPGGKAAGTPVPPKPNPSPNPNSRSDPAPKGERPRLPPTLARVPADEITDTDGGKFVRLDRLSTKDPMAYEEAFAKLTPAERDEYLRA